MEAGLYIVGTPLGNLGDITLRALETLREADLIMAEDTRRTRRLLARMKLTARLSRAGCVGRGAEKSAAATLLERLREEGGVIHGPRGPGSSRLNSPVNRLKLSSFVTAKVPTLYPRRLAPRRNRRAVLRRNQRNLSRSHTSCRPGCR